MRVECYFNLHKHVFSVRALEGPDKGRVILHASNVLLKDVSFVVQKAGREKVLRTGQKNVHAFVRGTLVMHDNELEVQSFNEGEPVYYNPRTVETFVHCRGVVSQHPIYTSPVAFLFKQMGKARIHAFVPQQEGA